MPLCSSSQIANVWQVWQILLGDASQPALLMQFGTCYKCLSNGRVGLHTANGAAIRVESVLILVSIGQASDENLSIKYGSI